MNSKLFVLLNEEIYCILLLGSSVLKERFWVLHLPYKESIMLTWILLGNVTIPEYSYNKRFQNHTLLN